MKPIRTCGLAALVVLIAMALLETTSAIAEKTNLCSNDSELCTRLTHIHETSVGKSTLLSSIATIECEVLFLGDAVSETSTPLKITGHLTYPMEGCQTKSGTLCEITETSKEATIEVLKTAHELAEVKGTVEVNVHCGAFINCTYDGEKLVGHALGPLLSTSANGNVNISEQVTHKVAGSLCPKEAKLDLTTTPLAATYIVSEAALKMVCLKLKERTGLYLSSGNGQTCTSDSTERVGFYELAEVLINRNSGEMACGKVEKSGFFLDSGNGIECQTEDNERKGAFELGTVS